MLGLRPARSQGCVCTREGLGHVLASEAVEDPVGARSARGRRGSQVWEWMLGLLDRRVQVVNKEYRAHGLHAFGRKRMHTKAQITMRCSLVHERNETSQSADFCQTQGLDVEERAL